MKIILSVVDMFGPTGPKHLEETGEGGGAIWVWHDARRELSRDTERPTSLTGARESHPIQID